MEVKLEVNDEQFENLLKEGIEALTKDDKKRMITEGFSQYINSNEGKDIIKNILFERRSGYWGNNEYMLTRAGTEILSSCITEKDFTDVRELLFDFMKEHGQEIIIKALADALMSGLFNNNTFANEFERYAKEAADRCVYDHINDMHKQY